MKKDYEETQKINQLWADALDKPVPFTVKKLANIIHQFSYPKSVSPVHTSAHSCPCRILAMNELGFKDILELTWPERIGKNEKS